MSEVEKTTEKMETFEALLDKLEEKGYKDQGYSDNSLVTIPGPLYADFLNTVGNVKRVLDVVKKNAEMMAHNIEMLEDNTAKLTLRLMKQHIENIDAGSTTPYEELDKEDAKKKIQEVK